MFHAAEDGFFFIRFSAERPKPPAHHAANGRHADFRGVLIGTPAEGRGEQFDFALPVHGQVRVIPRRCRIFLPTSAWRPLVKACQYGLVLLARRHSFSRTRASKTRRRSLSFGKTGISGKATG